MTTAKAVIPLRGREKLVARLSQMLSGYDDLTWQKLKASRRRTYKRAAESLIADWDKFASTIAEACQ
jgi:hypothetical protein